MGKFLFAAAAVLLLGGCAASGAKFGAVAPQQLESEKGRVYFYRPEKLFGAGIQPEVLLNGKLAGPSQPGGFFYVDVAPGDYEVSMTSEVEKTIAFHMRAGQTRYVRLSVGLGVIVYRVYPELASESKALQELKGLNQMDG